jgi:hypothetical protein
VLRTAFAAVLLVVCAARNAVAQSVPDATEIWGHLNLFLRLPHNLRLVAGTELDDAFNVDYHQWSASAGLGYRLLRMKREHLLNIDEDKEHHVTTAAGYEYLYTVDGPSTKVENRLGVEITPRTRPFARWLVEDRNRFEFRWVNDKYSTRYRNRLSVERDVVIDGVKLTPYASAEFFYSWGSDSWDEEQYSLGLQVPWRHLAQLQVYYLRQECTSCEPGDANVVGITFNWFLRNRL